MEAREDRGSPGENIERDHWICAYVRACVYMCTLPVIKKDLLGLIDAFNYRDDSFPGASQNSQMYEGDHLQSLPLVHTVGRGTANGKDYVDRNNGGKT